MSDRRTTAQGSRRLARKAAAAVVLGFVGLASVQAAAEEATDARKVRTAAQEFDAGRRAYTEKDFAAAADHFENAFRDVPSPEALRLAIRSQQQAGNAARAGTLAELALAHYAGDAGTVTLAERVLREVRPALFKMLISCIPECGVVLDDGAVFDEAQQRLVLYVKPGKHEVAATWGHDRSRRSEVSGEAGKEIRLTFDAPEEAPSPLPTSSATAPSVREPVSVIPPAAPEEQRSGLPRGIAYVGIGLTTALTAATIWSGIDTRSSPGRDKVRSDCIDLGESCPTYQEGRDKQRRTNILLGTTLGMALTTSVLMIYTDWGSSEAPNAARSEFGALRLQPGVSWDNGPHLGAAGRF